jgi:outer membrane protein assembly factor BamD
MKRLNLFQYAAAAMILLLMGSGCQLFDRPIKSPSGKTADELYSEGLSKLNQRNYREAIETFYKLKYDFPAEAAAMMADLKIADAYFAKKDYLQAIESYEEFRRLHPTSPYMPYVIYMIGLCHYKLMRSIDRDQTHTRLALNEFQYVVANYPHTPYVYDARKKALECMKRLSAHEVYVGNFYYRKKKYHAAIKRYETALKKYPAIPLEDKVLYRLADSYRKTNQIDKAQKTLLSLIEQYPKSKYTKKARNMLNKLGYKAPAKVQLNQAPSKREQKTRPEEAWGGPTDAGPKAPAQGRLKEEGIRPILPSPAPATQSGTSMDRPATIAVATYQRSRMASRPLVFNAGPDEGGGVALSHGWTVRPSGAQHNQGSLHSGNASEKGTPHEDSGGVSPEPGTSPQKGRFAFGVLKGDKPINITADRMEAYQNENKVVFEGNVVINQEDLYLYARKITAELASTKEGGGVKRIEATGDVRITQADRVATCQRAEFDNLSRTIVLSGQPKIWQGKDRIFGERIIVQLDKEKVIIVGSDQKRVSAVIYPKESKTKVKDEKPSHGQKAARHKFSAPFAKAQPKAVTPVPPRETKAEKPTASAPPASSVEDEAARIAELAIKSPPDSLESPPGKGLLAEAARIPATHPEIPEESITDFVERWRGFWEKKDIDGYISCYSERFRSKGMDRDAWYNYKARLFQRYERIRVRIKDLAIKRTAEGFSVTFMQRFSSEGYEDLGQKTLYIEPEGGKWRILRETWSAVRRAGSGKQATVQKPHPAPDTSTAVDEEALLRLLDSWRESWQKRDAETYFSFYSKSFHSQGMDLGGWKRRRARHMLSSSYIRINLSQVKVRVLGDEATVRFIQEYISDSYRDRGWKVLKLKRESDGKWRIVAENWSPI